MTTNNTPAIIKVVDPLVTYELGSYSFDNKQAISEALESLKAYKGIVIATEEDAKFIKETRTKLNKLKEQLDRSRIDIKNEMGKPIVQMEQEFNDLKAIVTETHKDLDDTYKAHEQRLKDDKQAEIDKLIAKLSDEMKEELNIKHNPKWLNKGSKFVDIEAEIIEQIVAQQKAIALKSKHIEMIKTTAEANGVTADGYLQVLETGADVLDIISSINTAGEAKRQQEAELAEQAKLQEEYNDQTSRIRNNVDFDRYPEPTKEEVIDQAINEAEQEVEQEIKIAPQETGELFVRVAEFKATLSQLKAIDEFAASIGVEMMAHACETAQN